jgi:hypothetical protein
LEFVRSFKCRFDLLDHRKLKVHVGDQLVIQDLSRFDLSDHATNTTWEINSRVESVRFIR